MDVRGERRMSRKTGPESQPAASLTEEPASLLTEEPAASLTEEPAASLTEEPAASLTEEPAASLTEEPAASPPAGQPNDDRQTTKEHLWSCIARFIRSLRTPFGLGFVFILSYAVLRFEAVLELIQKMATNAASHVVATLEFIQGALTDAQSGNYMRLLALMLVIAGLLILIIAICEELLRRYVQTPWVPVYGSLRPNQSLDLRRYENGLRSISDITSSNGTGYIYVSGNVGGSKSRVLIVQLDSLVRVTNCFTTDVPSGQFSFISVSPKEELIVTSSSFNKISVMNDRGGLLRRVETGSRCGRCVSDGQSLYVCHPDRHCVTVLDDQGRKLLQIGDEEIKLAWFLTMEGGQRLYVSDERAKRLHVYDVSASGNWFGNCWRWIKALARRDTPLRQLQAEWVREIRGTIRGRETSFWPQGVCVDPLGTLLLSDRSEKCVHIYNKKGQILQKLRSPQITKPLGLTFNVTGDAVILVDHTSPASLIIFTNRD